MSRFNRYENHGVHNKDKTIVLPHEITRGGLAYTPADMARMTASGIPVHSQDLSTKFYDGSIDASFNDITSDRIKDNDINDMWEEHHKFVKYAKHINSKSKKSVQPKTE